MKLKFFILYILFFSYSSLSANPFIFKTSDCPSGFQEISIGSKVSQWVSQTYCEDKGWSKVRFSTEYGICEDNGKRKKSLNRLNNSNMAIASSSSSSCVSLGEEPICETDHIWSNELQSCVLCEPIPNSQEIVYTEEQCNIEYVLSIFPEDGSSNYVENISWSDCHNSCWIEVRGCPTGQLAFDNVCKIPEDYILCPSGIDCSIMAFGVGGSQECVKTCYCDSLEVFNDVVSCDELPVVDNNSTTPPGGGDAGGGDAGGGDAGGSGGDAGGSGGDAGGSGGDVGGSGGDVGGSGGDVGGGDAGGSGGDVGGGDVGGGDAGGGDVGGGDAGGGSDTGGGNNDNNSTTPPEEGGFNSSDLNGFDDLLNDSESYFNKWTGEFQIFSQNVNTQLLDISNKYDNARSLFDTEKSFSVPVGSTSSCLSFDFRGKTITFDLCTSFALLNPIVYFVTTILFMVGTFRFMVNHLLKGLE